MTNHVAVCFPQKEAVHGALEKGLAVIYSKVLPVKQM